MRAWQYVTPEGDRSRPYDTRAEAVVEAVYFCAFRMCVRLGVVCSLKRLPEHEAEKTFREIEGEGWKVEGVH